MIYIKRLLWLLVYPIMWLLASIVLMVTFVFFIFECLFLYIKNGDIKGCFNCFEIPFKFIEGYIFLYGSSGEDWYIDIKPKED